MPAAPLSDAELLARLVAFDTVSRNSNLPLAELLADYLDRPGAAVELLPSPDGSRANLLVRIGPEADPERREGLVLSGHMDVVPADDLELWTSDPFTLTDRGDRWVARGACDMKGFLALAANLAAGLEPARLRSPLVLLFTYGEEVGCLGSGQLVADWLGGGGGEPAPPLPRAAIIGEPTELRAVRLHKGHLKLRLSYRGRSAHSAYPHLGVNAIERAAAGVGALAALRRELEAERVASSEHFPEAPYAALNVGTLHGGMAVNVVPDRCVAEIGVRLLPGMEAEAMVERVRRAVAPTAAAEGFELEVLSSSPPLDAPAGAPVHRALAELTGRPGGGAVSFATDAGWLQHLGLDCAILGPGAIEVAHKPDEWVFKEDLARAREVLAGVVSRFCEAAPGASEAPPQTDKASGAPSAS